MVSAILLNESLFKTYEFVITRTTFQPSLKSETLAVRALVRPTGLELAWNHNYFSAQIRLKLNYSVRDCVGDVVRKKSFKSQCQKPQEISPG